MSKQYFTPMEAKVGEIIAVNGKGWLSILIKFFSTGISHVEILAVNPKSEQIESFSADAKGARFKPIKDVVIETAGDIYYLELRNEVREKLDVVRFGETIIALDGVPYDMLHFIGVAIDDEHIDWLSMFKRVPGWLIKTLKGVFQNTETKNKIVCSGASAWGLKNGLGLGINASEESPIDICRYNIYKKPYKILKGKDRGISKFNTVNIL